MEIYEIVGIKERMSPGQVLALNRASQQRANAAQVRAAAPGAAAMRDQPNTFSGSLGTAAPGRDLSAAPTAAPAATAPVRRTGGKVPGQLSQTPNAIRKRAARASAKSTAAPSTAAAGGAGAFGQMARQLSPMGPSSTGGTLTPTATGVRHTAATTAPAAATTAPAAATTAPAAASTIPTGTAAKGSMAKAIGSAMTAAAANYVNKQTGLNLATDPSGANPYDTPDSLSKAMNAAVSMAPAMAKQQKSLWDKAIANSKIDRAAGTVPESLIQNLHQQINNNLLQGRTSDWTKLEKQIPAQAQSRARQLVNDMRTAFSGIANLDTDLNKDTQYWNQLTKAANQALVLLNMRQSPGAGSSTTASAPATGQSSNLQAMQQSAAASRLTAQQLGINQNVIQDLQRRIPPGTDPKLDALFKAVGLY